MKTHYLKKFVIAMGVAAISMGSAVAAPFGGEDDASYAKELWSALEWSKMVGKGRVVSTPYVGAHPHGAILDTIDGKITVLGTTGPVIVKNNYGGPGVSKKSVADNPAKFLKAVTVMFKRRGYDTDNADWFWVKYTPDGALMKNPKGMKLAGRVAKGAPKGCIACHKAAPGGDMVYNHDKFAK